MSPWDSPASWPPVSRPLGKYGRSRFPNALARATRPGSTTLGGEGFWDLRLLSKAKDDVWLGCRSKVRNPDKEPISNPVIRREGWYHKIVDTQVCEVSATPCRNPSKTLTYLSTGCPEISTLSMAWVLVHGPKRHLKVLQKRSYLHVKHPVAPRKRRRTQEQTRAEVGMRYRTSRVRAIDRAE